MGDKRATDVRIFAVQTRFQEMARRPGGLTRDAALSEAKAQIEEIKGEYVDFVARELAELTQAFERLDREHVDAWQLDEMHARCAQLRDTGATMELDLISFVADNLCQVLDTIRAGARYDGAMITCHLDALMLAQQDQYRGLKPSDLPEMTDGLVRVLEHAHRQLAMLDKRPD